MPPYEAASAAFFSFLPEYFKDKVYASSEFMLVAKFMCGELRLPGQTDEDDAGPAPQDPNIQAEFVSWAQSAKVTSFENMLLDGKIFTPYETARMVHLMFTLNLLTTYLFGFYNRNEKAKDYLNDYAQSFLEKSEAVKTFERAAAIVARMRLSKGSLWLRKANAFSLIIAIAKNLAAAEEIGPKRIKEKLDSFGAVLPPAYELAAKEAVNNRKERELRNDWLLHTIFDRPLPV